MPCVRSAYDVSQGSSRVPAAEDVGWPPDVSRGGTGCEVIPAVSHASRATRRKVRRGHCHPGNRPRGGVGRQTVARTLSISSV
ncbi:hypothetical protein CBZ_03690 [Cellulomonas biazotea]|uniref:Uncharacterized protein n=1 Tax=Cellulomonas biazotea TaxID=1709 RepID=A0A402DMG8_9CELL|nr:hypothetical protein CBZ_03690 [Cellulomonas biazotea]